MSIPSISFQADPFRSRFSPAPLRTTRVCPSLPRDHRLDQSHLNHEGDEGQDSPGFLSALATNFQPSSDFDSTQSRPEATPAVSDLRAAVKDWLPEYSSYMDLSSLAN